MSLKHIIITAAALSAATSVNSATYKIDTDLTAQNGFDLFGNDNTSSLFISPSLTDQFQGLNSFESISDYGVDLLDKKIKSDKPRYQERVANHGPRAIDLFSEGYGERQGVMISGIPDHVYHIEKSDLEGLSQTDIINGIQNGNLLSYSMPTREEEADGVLSNAQYFRTNDDVLIVQAGHNAKSGFIGFVDNNNSIKIVNGRNTTSADNGSAYMTAFEGVMSDVSSGQTFVTVQYGVNIATISSYEQVENMDYSVKQAVQLLSDPNVKNELRGNESLLVSFNTSAIEDPRVENIIRSQARKEMAGDIASGDFHDSQLVAVNEVTGALSGHPFGMEYSRENSLSTRFTNVGCYLKKEVNGSGLIQSMGVSSSFSHPENTSCLGSDTAQIINYRGSSVFIGGFTSRHTSASSIATSNSAARASSISFGGGGSSSNQNTFIDLFNHEETNICSNVGNGAGSLNNVNCIDGGSVNIAPVPLPPGLLLILTGLGALAAMQMRQRKPAI